MKKLALVPFLLLFASVAYGQSASLDGSWVNVDPATGGITRVIFEHTAATDRVHVWGKCSPEECVWGPAALHLLRGVDWETPSYGFATYEPGWSTKHLAFERRGDELLVTVFTFFKDESGRPDYRSQNTFRRATADDIPAGR
jgi:hypothetical protein